MTANLERNEYDNDLTLGYKIAWKNKVPLRFIIMREDGTGINIKDAISTLLSRGHSLKEIFDDIIIENDTFTRVDAVMLYYEITVSNLITGSDGKPPLTLTEAGEAALVGINEFIEALNADRGENEALDRQFSDLNSFNVFYNAWLDAYKSQLNSDSRELIYITQAHAELTELAKQQPYQAKEIVIEKVKIVLHPKWKSKAYQQSEEEKEEDVSGKVDARDGIALFNTSETSAHVPMIQYNDANNFSYYRIRDKTAFDYDDFNAQSSKPNTIYMAIWAGSDALGSKAPKKSYLRCTLSLTSGIENGDAVITIECPRTVDVEGDGVNVIVSRIAKALPELDLGEVERTSVKGWVDIERFDVNQMSLHYLILNDRLLSTYLFVEESTKSAAEKKKIPISFRSTIGSSTDDTTLSTTATKSASSVVVEFGAMTKDNIRITISKAKSEIVLQQFMTIFTLLMRSYTNKRAEAENLLRTYIPTFDKITLEITDEIEETSPKQMWKESKISRLAKMQPEIFTKVPYADLCLCERQPIIIDKADVDAWKDMKVNGQERDVAEYPPRWGDNAEHFERHLYACPNDKFPHISMKSSGTDTSISSEGINYVPCCAATTAGHLTAEQFYSEIREKKGGDGHKLKTFKIVREGGPDTVVPKLLNDFLNSTTPHGQRFPYHRVYVPVSTSSFLHCVLMATGSVDYTNLHTVEKREAFVTNKRREIAASTAPAIYRQELYDFSEETIRSRMEDPTIFLDPYLFYRGIEEYFKVNIFVFAASRSLNKQSFSTNHEELMEVPRYSIMHLRPPRYDRPSIIILKHMGSESDRLRHPHCELVIRSNDVNGRLFYGDKTQILYNALSRVCASMIWSFPNMITEPSQHGSSVSLRKNPYSIILWETIFNIVSLPGSDSRKGTIISQRIDGHGKCRALNVKFTGVMTPSGGIPTVGTIPQLGIVPPQSRTVIATVMVPPSQPLSVPSSDDVFRISEADAFSIFGNPKGSTREGMWYSILDLDFAIFVPVHVSADRPITGPPPSIHLVENTAAGSSVGVGGAASLSVKSNPITELKRVRKAANILVRLIEWCWRWSYMGGSVGSSPLTTDQWCDIHMISDSSLNDTPIEPNYSALPHKLPHFGNRGDFSNQAIAMVSAWWPEYFLPNGQIRLYPSLYLKMRHHLKRWFGKYQGVQMPPPYQIEGLFVYDEDFIQHDDSIVLVGDHFEEWIRIRSMDIEEKTVVIEELSYTLSHREEPYLYHDTSTGKIYMVQNVLGRDKMKALKVAYHWYMTGHNVGYTASLPAGTSASVQTLPYIIYGISERYKMIAISGCDFSGGQPGFLQLLSYTLDEEVNGKHVPGLYAALLPIA